MCGVAVAVVGVAVAMTREGEKAPINENVCMLGGKLTSGATSGGDKQEKGERGYRTGVC